MRYSNVQSNQTITAQQLNLLAGDATGASNLLVHQTLGLFALGTLPTNGKTITLTINSVAITITFVSAIGSTAGNVLIAGTAAATVANLLNLLSNPSVTNANQVALASANQTLVGYCDYDQSGTNLAVSSVNNLTYAPLTSFTAATNVTSGTWTASTMKLYVEDGICFINGTEVYFTGGMTPAVTAPSTHPRIDLLTIDNTGTLAWVTGVEGTSPATPAYPNNKLVLCELYNVVGETQLLDNLNQSVSQGYVLNDVRPFLQNVFFPGAFGTDFIPDADNTRNLGSANFEWKNIYAKGGIFVNGAGVATSKYGGTGADGALSVSSGNINIDCGGAGYFEKNYISFSITGTGSVTFINPHPNGTIIALKVQGNVTLTSSAAPMLDASGMGAAGGASVTSTSGNVQGNGGNPTVAQNFIHFICGGGAAASIGSSVGSAGAAPTLSLGSALASTSLLKYNCLQCGAGGAGGGAIYNAGGGNSVGGAGGNGGGALLIECGGAFNFTTTNGISVAGKPGGNGSATATAYAYTGGAGGGAGMCLITYNTLTANTGTINVSGGAAGGHLFFAGILGTFYGPGSGASPIAAGTVGTSSNSTNSVVAAAGASGYSIVLLNNYLA